MTNPISSLNRYPRRPFKEKNFSKLSEKLANLSGTFDTSMCQDLSSQILDNEFNDLLDDVTTDMAKSNLKKYSKEYMKSNLQPLTGSYTARTNESVNYKPLSEDYELISKLMKRISQLELSQRFQEKEIKDKILRIKILEDKCKLYQNTKQINDTNAERVKQLENECERLQKQISEMEIFLSDYGLIWVGESIGPTIVESDGINLWKDDGVKSFDLDKEHSSEKYIVDYDKIICNIEELNMLMKSEESLVTLTGPQRMELKKKQAVPLTLYANGISLFSGPFRSFSDKSTRIVIQDIIDGYFPSELEERYPSGVPINLIDRRNIYFDIKQINAFQGIGKTLGGQSTTSKLLNDGQEIIADNQYTQPFTEIMSKDSSTQITMGQFLNKLPTHNISKDGRIISIRNSIKEILENTSQSSNLEAANVTMDTSSQIDDTSNEDLNMTQEIAQIKIRSFDGNKVYHINMRSTQLLKDLYQRLYSLTNMIQDEFLLVSSYPPCRQLLEMNLTLKDCGLTPNAFLCMKIVKKDNK